MAATTRWTLYDITASGIAGDGGGEEGLGTRAYSRADASVGDTFSIGAGNNRLYTNLDGSAQYVTLTSGVGLDPRFVAKDVTERLHNLGLAAAGYSMAQCVWENNKLMLYSGSTGTGSSATVTSGTNTAHLELGWGTKTDVGGQATSNTYSSGNSGITVSGTYNGFLDEMYHIVMTKDLAINTPTKGGSNSYTGVLTTGGVYNGASTLTYTLDIDVTNGTTMGAGTGNVPTVDWVSTGSADDNTGDPLELLYPNYWYKIGTRGLMVKFTDAVFNTCNPAWTILCDQPQYVVGSNAQAPAGSAKYVWSSTRGDDATTSVVTSAAGTSRLGSRGLTISFNGSGNFNVGDEFFVICKPPQPSSYDISSLNYGNVTVSTESPVKPVLFEILSGATEVSTIKFGLQKSWLILTTTVVVMMILFFVSEQWVQEITPEPGIMMVMSGKQILRLQI